MRNRTKFLLVFLGLLLTIYPVHAQTSTSVGQTAVSETVSKNQVELASSEVKAPHYSDSESSLSYRVTLTGEVQKLPDPTPVVVESTVSNSFITARFTRYGVDCSGCSGQYTGSGGTAGGVKVSIDSVRQSNGEWTQGITYDGYYIIAADSSIPMYSIVEISNHSLSGMGLQPGVTFQAMVLDRGSGVNNTEIDLFVGTEKLIQVAGKATGATVTIIRYGK